MFASRLRTTRSAGANALHRLLAVLIVAVVSGGLLAGCGGKSSDNGSDLDGPTASEVSDRFSKNTGIRLSGKESAGVDSWTLLGVDGTDHFDRFGAFSLYVVKDKSGLDILLRPSDGTGELTFNSQGYAFNASKSGDSYSVVQRFGDNIVLIWQAGEKPELEDSFRRLSTAVKAAATGDASEIPASQRDCAASGIDPEAGKEGTCRVGDREVTVVDSGSELTTPVLKARLRSVRDTPRIEPSTSYGRAITARGRYLIVTYELTNTGDKPIDGIEPQLVVNEKTYAVARSVDYELYGDAGRPFPLQPGDTATIHTAFDVAPAVVDAARERGALVLPAEADDYGYLSVDNGAAEGRIRLAGSGAGADEPLDTPQRTTPDSSSDPYSAPEPSTRSSSSPRAIRRQHRAERALKQFFTAVRAGSAPGVCTRLTDKTVAKEGGLANCRQKIVLPTIQREVPKSNRRLRFMTILTRSDTRATVIIKANGYRGIARLARQQGLWRVQGLKRTR